MKTPEEIKKGLEICSDPNANCEGCPYCKNLLTYLDCSDALHYDNLLYIKQLESDLEHEKLSHQHTFEHAEMFKERLHELNKAELEGRLIILPYSPGTIVYAFDNACREAVPTKYSISMYGQRCALTKEEFYERLYKDYGIERKDH